MSVVKVTNAHISYGTKSKSSSNKVLSGFNMEVEQGTVYAMMGSSGKNLCPDQFSGIDFSMLS